MGNRPGANQGSALNCSLLIRPEAEAETAEAFDWYEGCVRGLGAEFLLAVDATMNAVCRKKDKRKKQQRRRTGAKPVGCTALLVVDSSRIRRVAMGNCKRARTTFEKAERDLDAYESLDKPAFVRWCIGGQSRDLSVCREMYTQPHERR